MLAHRRRFRAVLVALAAALVALALAACGGSSSSNATSLLRQTFSGAHPVNSGNLNVELAVNPGGSSTLKGPITVSFGGPFASLGKNEVPKSDFNVAVSAEGHSGSLGILSTGSAGYVTLQGTSYQLPDATFRQLESSFSSLTSSAGGGSNGSGALSKLGINPLDWLVDPKVAGQDQVGGTSTTHIRAGVNVPALLTDLNTFLGRASSLGISGASKLPKSISQQTANRIASEVRQPSFEVWTGNSDKTLRKLIISLTLPVTGQLSSLLGGLNSAQMSLTMQYADLNQPQTINSPTSVAPFSQFQSKVSSFVSALQSTINGATGSSSATTGSSGSTSTSGSSGSTSTSGSAASSLSPYTKCLQAAGNNITKEQACAPLLNGK